MFTLTINTDGAAFGETDDECAIEVARILHGLGDAVELCSWGNRVLMDINGNKVGSWEIWAKKGE